MKRILVIEDDDHLRQGMVKALQRHGYEVWDAADGDAGLELASTRHPELVLSDINLPGKTGLEVLMALRGRPESSVIPVILMTGEPHRADARSTMDLGADDYLQKPFTFEQMLGTVRARLERQAGIQRAWDAQNQAERITSSETIRIQTAALEAAANGIVITDADARILWVNSAFAHLTGYTPPEVLGQNPRVLKSGRHPQPFYAEMWDTIKAGRVWHGELVNRRKDGSEYDEEMTITAVRGEDGRIQHYIAIKQDISKRKQAEQELVRKSAFLEAQVNSSFDGIMVVDDQGRKVLQNKRMLDVLRVPAEIAGNDNIAVEFEWAQAQAKNPEAFTQRIRHLISHREEISREEIEFANGMIVDRYSAPVVGKNGTYFGRMWTFRDITEHKRAEQNLRESEEKFRQLAANVSDVFWITSPDLCQMHYVSPAYEQIWGRSMERLYAHPHEWAEAVLPEERGRVFAVFASLTRDAAEVSTEYRITRPDGTVRWVHDRGFQVRDAAGRLVRLAGIASDITQRKHLETELFQARKLESIGQLAAGIAHEINTPIQYVGDNTRFVKDAFTALARILDSHQALLAAAKAGAIPPALLAEGEQVQAAADLEYLRGQIPQALAETLEGVERVRKIVQAMKDFSHPGDRKKTPADLNKAIGSTVTVARNEWKYVAELELDLDPNLPFVPCFLGEFNQVILNLVVNAAHAIGDKVRKTGGGKGRITIKTRGDAEWVEIRVSDTGTGIPEAARSKVFELFFTTKDVGKGTGQGLAMAYGTVVKRHGGTVTFETATGLGTTFVVRLPVKPPSETGTRPTPAANATKP